MQTIVFIVLVLALFFVPAYVGRYFDPKDSLIKAWPMGFLILCATGIVALCVSGIVALLWHLAGELITKVTGA